MPGRVFVATGSNKGIGKSIVKLLLQDKEEKIVYLTSRSEELGQKAVKELESLGLKPKYHQLDISDQNSINSLRDYLVEKYGGLDVLVNNAGIAFRGTSAYSGALVTSNCNFFGTLNVCDALFPILRANGCVIHISSISGCNAFRRLAPYLKEMFTDPNLTVEDLKQLINNFIEATKSQESFPDSGWPTSAYGVSKLGVSFLTQIQQKKFDQNEAAKNIRVNCCCPGLVNTDMTSKKHDPSTMLDADQGADTPVYLALLPPNAPGPKGCFCQKRQPSLFPPVD